MRKKKKEKILKTARGIFARQGFYSSKMEEIANAAGVAKGSLYLYFESKEALYVEVILDIFSETDRILEVIIDSEKDFWEKINTLTENALKYFMENKDSFMILRREAQFKSIAPQSGEIMKFMEERITKLTCLFEEGRRRDCMGDDFSARQAALFCLNLIEGAALRILEGWENYSKDSSAVVLKFLKKGLA